jgi:hypothetical protein
MKFKVWTVKFIVSLRGEGFKHFIVIFKLAILLAYEFICLPS